MGHVESAERDIEVHDQEEEQFEQVQAQQPQKAIVRPELPEKQRVEELRERVQEQIE